MENTIVEYILCIGELPVCFPSAFSSDPDAKSLKVYCLITYPRYQYAVLVVDGPDLKTDTISFMPMILGNLWDIHL